MRIAYWIHRVADTHSEYVIYYCFFTAKMVTRTRLNVTFTRTLPVLLITLGNPKADWSTILHRIWKFSGSNLCRKKRLLWLINSVVFISLSRRVPGFCLQLSHDHFIPNSMQKTIQSSILRPVILVRVAVVLRSPASKITRYELKSDLNSTL
jgi:hypothetical protein